MEFLEFLVFLIAAMFCIVLHEFSHAYVALLNGDRTARQAGRLSLNPVRHFDLIGFLLFVFCRVGYAKPVPVNPYYFKNRKVGIITVALSGVAVNLILSFLCVPILMLCIKFLQPVMVGTVAGARGYQLIYTFFYSIFSIGICLFLFNIIPIYPLDGYNVVECLFGCTNSFMHWLRDYAMYILLSVAVTFYLAELFGLPSYFNPGYWYIEVLGGKIMQLFWNIWLPLFI